MLDAIFLLRREIVARIKYEFNNFVSYLMLLKYTFLSIVFLLLSTSVDAQKENTITWNGLEKMQDLELDKVTYSNLNKEASKIQLKLIAQGFLAANIDSIIRIDSLKYATVYFFTGPKFSFANLVFDTDSKTALINKRGEERWQNELKASPHKVQKLMYEVLTYYENNGYPFVRVSLSDIDLSTASLKGEIVVDKGPLVHFSEMKVAGIKNVNEKLIRSLFAIRAGELYSQEKIDKLAIRIKEIAYLAFEREPEYEIVNQKCAVYLYLKKKNANSFNAILGLLPKDNGGVNITGDVRIKLHNQLNRGELIDFNWRKLLPLTQNLNVHFNYPFLFGSDFGIDTKFDLYKKDTSYVDMNTYLGLEYFWSSKLKLKMFYKNRTANIISVAGLEFATTLPDFADVRVNFYGLGLELNTLDYKNNPTKGWYLDLEGSIGGKTIKKNASLNSVVYENIDLTTTQLLVSGRVERFFKLGKKSTIQLKANGGIIANEEGSTAFENELFRLGGLRTIRGFDEESLFASSYIVATTEYRFILEQNSNLFLFGEWMSYEKQVNSSYTTDEPYSFGAGINFQTKAGIFSMSYALGSQQNNPILFRSAKIHFGFINYF